ncbi:ABC transporter ATP-binding protein [Paenibacillus xanthanilyticus]|uniref:ABC transporter ATP-binding protein n=1 Tax=Paenibacillus xanthanilyticus TaxID=1783531 RepID=A0ABV8JZ60_9BACL
MKHVLEIARLTVTFRTDRGDVRPVDDISIAVRPGETVCIVGESGSGKSVASLAILNLLGKGGEIGPGRIRLAGEPLTEKSEAELRKMRGKEAAMIFQEPMTALNPVLTIGDQLREAIRLHAGLRGKAADAYAAELLREAGIARAEQVLKQYPHSLSGGMRQRVVIAMAIAGKPKLLIADEPTTALDVTVQAQILTLLKRLRTDHDTAILLITHDLGVVAEMADRVLVMYAGQIVEETDVFTLFDRPLHPYTRGLMKAVPVISADLDYRLEAIPGSVPDIGRLPQGCRFHPRCPSASDRCRSEMPALAPSASGHLVRCWLAGQSPAS